MDKKSEQLLRKLKFIAEAKKNNILIGIDLPMARSAVDILRTKLGSREGG
jgi:hypothetical protein